MNFSDFPIFDNHTHTLDPNATKIEPIELAREFLHGFGDILPENPDPLDRMKYGYSDELNLHIANMGCVHAMVNHLARLFDCEPTLEAVTAERNKLTAGGIDSYVKLLYTDANIQGTVVDSLLPMNDKLIDLFPCKVLRLFKLDVPYFKLVAEKDSYREVKEAIQARIEYAVKTEGYIGIKCHIAEMFTLDARPVYDEEASKAFAAAKANDREAMFTIYLGIFTATMLQCQELNVPLHIHTGVTGLTSTIGWPNYSGFRREGHANSSDPFLLMNFLTEPQFMNTKLVLLHTSFPWVRNAAMMAHDFPHVWVDLGWTIPWVSLGSSQVVEEVLSIAPHSKIMLGSGQHGIPEIAWLSGKILKSALKAVLTNAVMSDYISEQQAYNTAEMLCYGNAKRLYSL